MREKYGFTLLELIIVIIIIGVLAALAITGYRARQESAKNQEAIANLKIIQSAQKFYRMEHGEYYGPTPSGQPCANDLLNQNLKLSLPGCSAPNFNYRIMSADADSFEAGAGRCGAANLNYHPIQYQRIWHIFEDSDEPCCENCGVQTLGCRGENLC